MPRSLSWAQERWCILYHSCPFLSSLCWIKNARSLFVYNHLILSFACSILPFWWKERRKWKSFRCVWLSVTPRTIQSMEFSRQEYWSEKTFPSPRDLPNPGVEPGSPALQADSLPTELSEKKRRSIMEKKLYTSLLRLLNKIPRIGCFDQQNLLLMVMEPGKSQIRVWLGGVLVRPLFLAYRQLPSYHVITWCRELWFSSFSYKGTNSIRSGLHPYDL